MSNNCLPTRRALVARGAGLAALAAGAALPTMPEAVANSSAFEEEYAEYVRLSKVADAASMGRDEASDGYIEPERPGWTSDDAWLFEVINDRRYLDVSDRNVARLKKRITTPCPDPSPDAAEFHARDVACARRTLARIEEWKAEVVRRKKACGLLAAERREAEANTAVEAKVDEILVMHPANRREVAIQALMVWDHRPDSELFDFVESLISSAGVVPHYRAPGYYKNVAALQ